MVSVSRLAGPPQWGQVVLTHSVWRARGLSPSSAGLKVLDLGQAQGQLALGQGLPTALLAVDHGDGLAPVALAAEDPVAQLEVDLACGPCRFPPAKRTSSPWLPPRTGRSRNPELTSVPVATSVKAASLRLHGLVALDHLDDGQAELVGKLPVAGIVGRDGHDGAGAIGSQDIIGDEDGDLLAVDRVDGLERPRCWTPVFSLLSSVRSKSDLRAASA